MVFQKDKNLQLFRPRYRLQERRFQCHETHTTKEKSKQGQQKFCPVRATPMFQTTPILQANGRRNRLSQTDRRIQNDGS